MSAFAALLREHRLRVGLTQEQLGSEADCDHTYVAYLETGRRRAPSRQAVLAFSLALELDQAQTDRLLFAAGLAPETDYQALYERFAPPVEQMKWCPRCEADLPVDRFPKDRCQSDGRNAQCRTCKAARQAHYRTQRILRDQRRSA